MIMIKIVQLQFLTAGSNSHKRKDQALSMTSLCFQISQFDLGLVGKSCFKLSLCESFPMLFSTLDDIDRSWCHMWAQLFDYFEIVDKWLDIKIEKAGVTWLNYAKVECKNLSQVRGKYYLRWCWNVYLQDFAFDLNRCSLKINKYLPSKSYRDSYNDSQRD